jgi:hypothetical protein
MVMVMWTVQTMTPVMDRTSTATTMSMVTMMDTMRETIKKETTPKTMSTRDTATVVVVIGDKRGEEKKPTGFDLMHFMMVVAGDEDTTMIATLNVDAGARTAGEREKTARTTTAHPWTRLRLKPKCGIR